MTSFAKNRNPRRSAARAAALIAVAAAGLAAAPSASAAEPWGFEQVTPVNKGAGAVNPIDTFQTTPDGNGLLLTATSEFAEAPAGSVPLYTRYFASRGVDGWSNRSMDPPTGPTKPNNISTVMAVLSASADASHVMVASTLPLTPDSPPGEGSLYIRSTATGAYTRVAGHEDSAFIRQYFANLGNFGVRYVAPDGRSALFVSVVPLVPGAPDGRLDNGLSAALYSWTVEDGVRAVSVLPDSEGGGIAPALVAVGGESDYGIRNPLPDSGGLDHVYFSIRDLGGYVHSGGETRAVSVSRIPGASSDPVPVQIMATARDGRFMLFTADASTPLTSDVELDSAAARHLYRYNADDDSLTYIGPSMLLQSPVQMSQDGQTVAFYSPFQLSPDAPEYANEGWPARENLYVWRDGVTRFVARIDPDSNATIASIYMRVLSSNGRYLAYTDNSTGPWSGAARTGANLGGPNASCRRELSGGASEPEVCGQVFVFDADEGELACASCRTDGLAPKGPGGDPTSGRGAGRVRMDHRQMQTVADDGTTFFTTGEDLVEADVNGLNDVYAFRDGEHRLVSRATEKAPARFLDATPDGKSVFIATSDAIAPTDDDNAIDVYMTREGAGFPYTAPIVEAPCEGSECRAPFAPAAPLPLAGSVAFSGSGNVRSGGARLSVSGVKSIVGTAGSLRVKVPGRGRVTVSGAGVKTAKRSVSRAGTYTVRVALTAKARKALKKSKSAKKKVRVTFSPADGRASRLTLSLTYKSKPANKKKGR